MSQNKQICLIAMIRKRVNIKASIRANTLPDTLAQNPQNAPGLLNQFRIQPIENLGFGLTTSTKIKNSTEPFDSLEVVHDTATYSVTQNRNEQGEYFGTSFQFFLPNNPVSVAWCDDNKNKDFLVVGIDRNGNSILLGSEQYPLRMVQSRDSGTRAGRNQIAVVFSTDGEASPVLLPESFFVELTDIPSTETTFVNNLLSAQPSILPTFVQATIDEATPNTFSVPVPDTCTFLGLLINNIVYNQGTDFDRDTIMPNDQFTWHGDFELTPDDQVFAIYLEGINNVMSLENIESIDTIGGEQSFDVDGDTSKVLCVSVNNIDYYGDYYNVSETTVYWRGAFLLESTDVVVVKYLILDILELKTNKLAVSEGQSVFVGPSDTVGILAIYVNQAYCTQMFTYDGTFLEFAGDFTLGTGDIIELIYLTNKYNND